MNTCFTFNTAHIIRFEKLSYIVNVQKKDHGYYLPIVIDGVEKEIFLLRRRNSFGQTSKELEEYNSMKTQVENFRF